MSQPRKPLAGPGLIGLCSFIRAPLLRFPGSTSDEGQAVIRAAMARQALIVVALTWASQVAGGPVLPVNWVMIVSSRWVDFLCLAAGCLQASYNRQRVDTRARVFPLFPCYQSHLLLWKSVIRIWAGIERHEYNDQFLPRNHLHIKGLLQRECRHSTF